MTQITIIYLSSLGDHVDAWYLKVEGHKAVEDSLVVVDNQVEDSLVVVDNLVVEDILVEADILVEDSPVVLVVDLGSLAVDMGLHQELDKVY